MLISIILKLFWVFWAAVNKVSGSWPASWMAIGESSGQVWIKLKVEGLFLAIPWLDTISVDAREQP